MKSFIIFILSSYYLKIIELYQYIFNFKFFNIVYLNYFKNLQDNSNSYGSVKTLFSSLLSFAFTKYSLRITKN